MRGITTLLFLLVALISNVACQSNTPTSDRVSISIRIPPTRIYKPSQVPSDKKFAYAPSVLKGSNGSHHVWLTSNLASNLFADTISYLRVDFTNHNDLFSPYLSIAPNLFYSVSQDQPKAHEFAGWNTSDPTVLAFPAFTQEGKEYDHIMLWTEVPQWRIDHHVQNKDDPDQSEDAEVKYGFFKGGQSYFFYVGVIPSLRWPLASYGADLSSYGYGQPSLVQSPVPGVYWLFVSSSRFNLGPAPRVCVDSVVPNGPGDICSFLVTLDFRSSRIDPMVGTKYYLSPRGIVNQLGNRADFTNMDVAYDDSSKKIIAVGDVIPFINGALRVTESVALAEAKVEVKEGVITSVAPWRMIASIQQSASNPSSNTIATGFAQNHNAALAKDYRGWVDRRMLTPYFSTGQGIPHDSCKEADQYLGCGEWLYELWMTEIAVSQDQ